MAQSNQKQEFQERLQRISGSNAATGKPVKILNWRENIRYPAQIIGAFLLGMIMMLLLRYMRFHLMPVDPQAGVSISDAIVDLVLVVAGGWAIRQLFHLEVKAFQSAQMVGAFAMASLMHNFVYLAPELFDQVFSPEWTAHVIATTEPSSFQFGELSLKFGAQDQPAPFQTEAVAQGEVQTPQQTEQPQMPRLIVMDSER